MLLRVVASFAVVSAVSLLSPTEVRADAQVPYPAAASGQYTTTIPYILGAGDDGIIEVTIGKTIMADTCNSLSIAGDSLTKSVVSGWGTSYYVFQKGGSESIRSTKMNCGGATADRFVAAAILPASGSESTIEPSAGHFFIRNSQEGTAFYLPDGYELRFKMWAPTGDEFTGMQDLVAPTADAQPSQESELRAAADKPAVNSAYGAAGGKNPAFAGAGRMPAL